MTSVLLTIIKQIILCFMFLVKRTSAIHTTEVARYFLSISRNLGFNLRFQILCNAELSYLECHLMNVDVSRKLKDYITDVSFPHRK